MAITYTRHLAFRAAPCMTDQNQCQPHVGVYQTTKCCAASRYIAHFQQECHNSKFGIFELLVEKEMFADALLTGIVS
jgi:hypothetical protein